MEKNINKVFRVDEVSRTKVIATLKKSPGTRVITEMASNNSIKSIRQEYAILMLMVNLIESLIMLELPSDVTTQH